MSVVDKSRENHDHRSALVINHESTMIVVARQVVAGRYKGKFFIVRSDVDQRLWLRASDRQRICRMPFSGEDLAGSVQLLASLDRQCPHHQVLEIFRRL